MTGGKGQERGGPGGPRGSKRPVLKGMAPAYPARTGSLIKLTPPVTKCLVQNAQPA